MPKQSAVDHPAFHSLVLSCEHASRRVPASVAPLFVGKEALLETHRAYDKGAIEVARAIEAETNAPLFAGDVTRLVVDLNRSPRHRGVFSEITRPLSRARRQELVETHHTPYQEEVRRACRRSLGRGRCLHVTLHSFTPVFNGVARPMDIGLLYDPARSLGTAVADAWEQALLGIAPDFVVRRNAPYTGVQDGLVPLLRTELPASRYDGVEIEMNQRHFEGTPHKARRMIDVMTRSFREVWEHCRR